MENTNLNNARTLWDLSIKFDKDDNDASYDVYDSSWDWGCCLIFNKYPEEGDGAYERFCCWLAHNLELDPDDADVYSEERPDAVTCKAADLMWKHRDVFEPFFNEQNKRGYRPKDFGEIDPDCDDGFFEAYMLPLESLMVGNYSESDYAELLEKLPGGDEIQVPPSHELAVKTSIYLKMRPGETQEEAWARLMKCAESAGLTLLDPDTKNIEVRED